MSHRDTWERVNRDCHCPICDHWRWCLVSRDGLSAICARIEKGSLKKVGSSGAGWLHRLGPADARTRQGRKLLVQPTKVSGRADLAALSEAFRRAVHPPRLKWLAHDLGLSVEGLERLRIGWCEPSKSWSFPMVDHSRNVLGIRLRAGSGKKFSVTGGHEGLFIADGLAGSGPLLIAEGATDTCALLDLGFDAIGRPSCRGGTRLILDLVRQWRPASVVVVADNDAGGQGRDGAVDLVRRLAIVHRDARLIAPPPAIKDVRAWKRSGATAADVERVIAAAPPIRVKVVVRDPESPRAGGSSHAR
jgi:hypothetical protein